MRRSHACFLVALFATLLLTPALSWGAGIVIDEFDDDNYSDDGLLFDTRTLAADSNTIASIGGGALGVLDFESNTDGFVTLTYATNSAGIAMTATGGFELEGVFLGAAGQMLTWKWTARDNSNAVNATGTGNWTVGDAPLLMDPDGAGDYADWKTLEFQFDWTLVSGGALSLSASRLLAVPEPSSLALCGFVLLGMAGVGHRRTRRSGKQG